MIGIILNSALIIGVTGILIYSSTKDFIVGLPNIKYRSNCMFCKYYKTAKGRCKGYEWLVNCNDEKGICGNYIDVDRIGKIKIDL